MLVPIQTQARKVKKASWNEARLSNPTDVNVAKGATPDLTAQPILGTHAKLHPEENTPGMSDGGRVEWALRRPHLLAVGLRLKSPLDAAELTKHSRSMCLRGAVWIRYRGKLGPASPFAAPVDSSSESNDRPPLPDMYLYH